MSEVAYGEGVGPEMWEQNVSHVVHFISEPLRIVAIFVHIKDNYQPICNMTLNIIFVLLKKKTHSIPMSLRVYPIPIPLKPAPMTHTLNLRSSAAYGLIC